MAQSPPSDAEITAALVRGVKAMGSDTTERAQRLGYQKRRIEQFERGLFPTALIRFARAGIIAINAITNEPKA